MEKQKAHARVVTLPKGKGNGPSWRVVIDDKLFPLTFPTASAAQDFADLCNRKPPTCVTTGKPKTITLTLSGKVLTFTPSEWTNFLRGTLQ